MRPLRRERQEVMKDRVQIKLMNAIDEAQHELASIIVRIQITRVFEIVR